jgi:hypothetical protein
VRDSAFVCVLVVSLATDRADGQFYPPILEIAVEKVAWAWMLAVAMARPCGLEDGSTPSLVLGCLMVYMILQLENPGLDIYPLSPHA